MRRKQSVLGTLIFAAIFFVAGFMAYQHLTKPLAEEAEASKEWPSTQGVITFSELSKSHNSEGNTMYSANVHYTYSVGSNKYNDSNIRTVDGSSSSKRAAKNTVRKYAKGTKVTVFYDPEFPNTAVLEPGTDFLFGMLLKLPLVFCIGAVLMVLGMLKRLLFGR